MSNIPTGGDPPPYVSPSPLYEASQEDRTMAMIAYILGIFTGFLGPLIVWLIKKDQSKFVAYHGLQALLLHAVVVVGYIVSSFLMAFLIGFVTYPAFFIFGLVYTIIAGMAANKGEWYEIPIIGKFARQNVGI